ncbi:CHAP domain-containing protein [Streptomyces broussonetiae]|uniref:CHAP domain-containing protein n=1 Tax=Streptomyces broussonetiae TaxID=2686304 RepID=A0ABV5EJ58_9ACTN
MPPKLYDRRRLLQLGLAVAAGSVGATIFGPATRAWAETGGYPYAAYNGPGSNPVGSLWTNPQGGWYSPYGYVHRNCTDYVAWKLQDLGVPDGLTRGLGNGGDWYNNAVYKTGLQRGTSPQVGAAAVSTNGGWGHVAYVETVHENGDITTAEYNWPTSDGSLDGAFHRRQGKPATMGFSKFVYFGEHMTNPPGSGGGSTPTVSIIAVKRTTDPSGVRQVYAATNTAVTEGWWVPGGNGVHLHEVINIAQGNIVGFDKVNLPGGTQAVYAAVPDGVWETWWKPDGTTGTTKIVSGLSGVKQVIADNRTENGQFVHRLYVLAGDGPHEVWWKDGGDGIHVDRLNNIANPVAMTSSTGPNGAYQLYVATATWVYELWWFPGGTVHTGTIINISQGDIRSLTKDANQSNGGQRLYTTTSTTVWESSWGGGASGISHHARVVGQTNAQMSEKMMSGTTNQLYVATNARVQEYWWHSSGSGGSTLINIAQGNIKAIDKYNDGSAQQLYTGAGAWVYETWWGGGASPSTSGLFQVAH